MQKIMLKNGDLTLRDIRLLCQNYQCFCDECPMDPFCRECLNEFNGPSTWIFEDDSLEELSEQLYSRECPICGGDVFLTTPDKNVYEVNCSNDGCPVNKKTTPGDALHCFTEWEKINKEVYYSKERFLEMSESTDVFVFGKELEHRAEEIKSICKTIENCLANTEDALFVTRNIVQNEFRTYIRFDFEIRSVASVQLRYNPKTDAFMPPDNILIKVQSKHILNDEEIQLVKKRCLVRGVPYGIGFDEDHHLLLRTEFPIDGDPGYEVIRGAYQKILTWLEMLFVNDGIEEEQPFN